MELRKDNDMSAVASAIVAALTALLPLISGASGSAIDNIIAFLIQAIPLVQEEISAIAGPIENVITALKNNNAITADQLTALQTAETSYDSAFESAASAAGFPQTPSP